MSLFAVCCVADVVATDSVFGCSSFSSTSTVLGSEFLEVTSCFSSDTNGLDIYPVSSPLLTLYQSPSSPINVTSVFNANTFITSESVVAFSLTFTYASFIYAVFSLNSLVVVFVSVFSFLFWLLFVFTVWVFDEIQSSLIHPLISDVCIYTQDPVFVITVTSFPLLNSKISLDPISGRIFTLVSFVIVLFVIVVTSPCCSVVLPCSTGAGVSSPTFLEYCLLTYPVRPLYSTLYQSSNSSISSLSSPVCIAIITSESVEGSFLKFKLSVVDSIVTAFTLHIIVNNIITDNILINDTFLYIFI